jgi:rod shape-determining protein MreD
MLGNILQKFGQPLRSLVPFGTTLAFIFASVIIWPLPFIGEITPSFGIIAVYYWAIYRPDLFRPLVVFLLGILNDALHFLDFGLSPIVFIGVYQLAFSHRRFFVGQMFFVLGQVLPWRLFLRQVSNGSFCPF